MNNEQYIKSIKVDELEVKIYNDRQSMGKAAADEVAEMLKLLLQQQENVRMVFAAAPSQNELLSELSQKKNINWQRITAFHMDEYIGLDENSPQSFAHYLKQNIFSKLPFKNVYLISRTDLDAEANCTRYADLFKQAPIDVICMGIGENGHIAFNDPPVADFNDPNLVKVVQLDNACRVQQVNDGCFSSLEAVPEKAITLTIPAMLSAKHLFIVVPGKLKAKAIERTLNGAISTECPASVLRTHKNAKLFLDKDSSMELKNITPTE